MVFRITLVFDVVSNDRHRGITNGIGVVALGPEVTAPEFGLHHFVVGEDCSGSDAFDLFDNV